MSEIKEYTHALGVKVKVMYLNSSEDTYNQATFDGQLQELFNHTKMFDGNLFPGMTIEIWDYRLPNIPKNVWNCTNNVNTLITKGIGDYAGLTSAQIGLMQLNSRYMQNSGDMSQLLSHEFGHYKAFFMGFYNVNSVFKRFWDKIRGIHATPNTPVVELVAEDLREDEGATGAIGVERTDKYNYIQADKVQGLKDFYAIWKPAQAQIDSFYKDNKPSLITRIVDPTFNYSTTDFNYIEVNFAVVNYMFSFMNQVYKINRNGIYKNGSCIKYFAV